MVDAVYNSCGLSVSVVFFFQAEDGIRDLVRSRGLGDVYKRQALGQRAGVRGRLRVPFVSLPRERPSLRRIRRAGLLSLIHI